MVIAFAGSRGSRAGGAFFVPHSSSAPTSDYTQLQLVLHGEVVFVSVISSSSFARTSVDSGV